MFLRFIHVLFIGNSFLCIVSSSTLSEYTTVVCVPVVGHLGCFQFLAIRNKSYWGYFCTRLFVDIVFISLEKYLKVELQVLGQIDVVHFGMLYPEKDTLSLVKGYGQEYAT